VKGYTKYFTSLFWILALGLLYFMNPEEAGMSLCPLTHFNLPCPGCGIGHAIHYALHGNLKQSLSEHWLGVPAIIGIGYMAIQPFLFYSHKSIRV
jgi:hypothetical protein